MNLPERHALIDTSSIAKRVADVLREVIFEMEPDTSLGSEEELTRRLGVSSTMLRQAARILEHEQLLAIRRGPAGGYFSRRPAVDAAVHVSAVFLRAHGASPADALEVSLALCDLIVRRAVDCRKDELWADLGGFADGGPGCEADLATSSIFPLLARMSGNLCVELMVFTFIDYLALLSASDAAEAGWDARARRRRDQLRRRLAQAMLDRRQDDAVALMRELMESYRTYLPAMARGGASPEI